MANAPKINGYVNQSKMAATNTQNIKTLNGSLQRLSGKIEQKMKQLKFFSAKNSGMSSYDDRGQITSMNKHFTYLEDNAISVIFNFQKDHFALSFLIAMDSQDEGYKRIYQQLKSKKFNGKSLYPSCVSTAFNVDDNPTSFNATYKQAERFVLEFLKIVEQGIKQYQMNKKRGM